MGGMWNDRWLLCRETTHLYRPIHPEEGRPGVLFLSVNLQQLHVEDQGGHWRNQAWEASVAVGHHWRDGQSGLFAEGELGEALFPALDHHALADSELERLVSVHGGVELLAVGQRARVVHGQEVARLGEGLAVARRDDFDVELVGWRGGGGHVCSEEAGWSETGS